MADLVSGGDGVRARHATERLVNHDTRHSRLHSTIWWWGGDVTRRWSGGVAVESLAPDATADVVPGSLALTVLERQSDADFERRVTTVLNGPHEHRARQTCVLHNSQRNHHTRQSCVLDNSQRNHHTQQSCVLHNSQRKRSCTALLELSSAGKQYSRLLFVNIGST